jgi:hypothetical protein
MKSFIVKDSLLGNSRSAYNPESVNQSIAAHNRRSSDKIGKREARLIHALLKGRLVYE